MKQSNHPKSETSDETHKHPKSETSGETKFETIFGVLRHTVLS